MTLAEALRSVINDTPTGRGEDPEGRLKTATLKKALNDIHYAGAASFAGIVTSDGPDAAWPAEEVVKLTK